MGNEIDITRAGTTDIPVLLDLRERMLIELGSDDGDRLEELRSRSSEWMSPAIAEGRALGWIARRDGEIVGGVSMTVLETQPQYRSLAGRIASIHGLYVEPLQRGAGIATALVTEAVAWAEHNGIDIVTLHAADRARPVYERVGFAASSEMRMFLRDRPADDR